MLCCTLRFLAGGQAMDICLTYSVPFSTFYNWDYGPLWKTCLAIDAVYTIGLTTDASKLAEYEEGYSIMSSGNMRGCVMAIDGLVIQTRAPTRAELGPHGDVNAYRNR